MTLVRSKKRVDDHGEVFTPGWMVSDMLGVIADEAERINSRFLEPACGPGVFLVQVLERKLKTVEKVFGSNRHEREHHGLLALMSIYGLELLSDNASECRDNLLSVMSNFYSKSQDEALFKASEFVVKTNIIQANALTLTTDSGDHVVFAEWSYLTKGKFARRDFRFDSLSQRSALGGTLFEGLAEHEVFTPIREYPRMTISDIAMQLDSGS